MSSSESFKTDKEDNDDVHTLAEDLLSKCAERKLKPEQAVAALLMVAEFVSESAGIRGVVVHRDRSSIELLVKEKSSIPESSKIIH